MSKIDILEERCNLQEKLIAKVTDDLVSIRCEDELHYYRQRISAILTYMEKYKFTGRIGGENQYT